MKKLWQVKIECEYIGNIFNDLRTMTYYVHADSAIEAENIAESWLPESYDVINDVFDTTEYKLNFAVRPNIPAPVESRIPQRRFHNDNDGNETSSIDRNDFDRMFNSGARRTREHRV